MRIKIFLFLLVLCRAVTAQVPPTPYGLKLPQKPVLSPKQAELKASLGSAMVLRPALIILPGQFLVTNITIGDGQVITLSWNSNHPGPYQIWGSPNPDGPWTTVSTPTILLNDAFSAFDNRFWRVQSDLQLLSLNTNQPRLTWQVPRIDMSDTLQDFSVFDRTNNPTQGDPIDTGHGWTKIGQVGPSVRQFNDSTSASNLWYGISQVTVNNAVIPYAPQQFPQVLQGPQWVTQLYFPDPSPSQGYTQFYSGLQVNGSALDSSGNLYVCGHGDPYGSGQGPLYIAKYSPAGVIVWQKYLFGTLQKNECTDIVIDKDGNLIITGWCCGHIDFGGGVKEASGAGDPFVLKLSPTAGAYIWSTIFTGGGAGFVGDMLGSGIATDNTTGAIWVTGTYVGNVTVNHSDFPGATGSVALTQVGGQDIFLAKLATDGSVLWAKQFGSTSSEEHGNGIAVNSATGDCFMTGNFKGTVDFSQGTGTPLTSDTQYAPFVAKFNTLGASLASIAFQVTGSGTLGSDGPTGGRKCRLDTNGDLVVGGVFKNTTITIGSTTFTNKGPDTIDMFVTKLNSSTLNPSWAFSCGSNTSDNFFGLAIAPSGNIIFTGLFWRTMDVGSIQLSAIGIFDTYIIALSPAGVALSAVNYGSAGQVSRGTMIAVNPSSPLVYIGLLFGGPITFSTTVSLPTPTPSNRINAAILATSL